MVRTKSKDKCTKIRFTKCKEKAKIYNPIQMTFAKLLEKDITIKEFQNTVALKNLEVGEYSTDFLCIKDNGDLMVRECIFRQQLGQKHYQQLLDASKQYWARRGITDWGIVIDAKE